MQNLAHGNFDHSNIQFLPIVYDFLLDKVNHRVVGLGEKLWWAEVVYRKECFKGFYGKYICCWHYDNYWKISFVILGAVHQNRLYVQNNCFWLLKEMLHEETTDDIWCSFMRQHNDTQHGWISLSLPYHSTCHICHSMGKLTWRIPSTHSISWKIMGTPLTQLQRNLWGYSLAVRLVVGGGVLPVTFPSRIVTSLETLPCTQIWLFLWPIRLRCVHEVHLFPPLVIFPAPLFTIFLLFGVVLWC